MLLSEVQGDFPSYAWLQAGLQPWEGINAQDAVMLAYNAISMLRQQIRPDLRVHGVVHYDKTPLPVNGKLFSVKLHVESTFNSDP